MTHVLVVREAYGDMRRGDTVTHPDEIARLHSEAPNHFLRVARELHPHEVEANKAIDDAKAPETKKTKATSEKDA